MGLSIRAVGRAFAKPFEKVGQAAKGFFTGPDYDAVARDVAAQHRATGQSEFGSTAPRGPASASRPGGVPRVGGASGYQSAPPGGIPQTGGGGAQGWIDKGIEWVGNHAMPKKPDGSIDWARALELGLATWSAVEGYKATQKGEQLTEEAMAMARDDYAARKPLRDKGIANLMADRERPDLSHLTDQDNPYAPARRSRVPAVGSRARPGGY